MIKKTDLIELWLLFFFLVAAFLAAARASSGR